MSKRRRTPVERVNQKPAMPPTVPRRLLERCVRRDIAGRSIVGDLHQEWLETRANGRLRGDLWYWRVALQLALSMLLWRRGTPVRPPAAGKSSARIRLLERLGYDLHYSLRSLSNRPLSSLLAVLTLAIGISAVTAIFTIANTTLINPLPGIQDTDRLIELGRTDDGSGFDTFSHPEVEDLRRGAPNVFEQVAAFTIEFVSARVPPQSASSPDSRPDVTAREEASAEEPLQAELSDDIGGERLTVIYTTHDYFDALGVQPALGRSFSPTADEETDLDLGPVVILSHQYWQSRYQSNPEVIGSTLEVSREPATVIGVLPSNFKSHILGLDPAVWLPLRQHPAVSPRDSDRRSLLDNRRSSWLMSIGRLADGADLAQARAAADTIFESLAADFPDSNRNRGVSVVELGPVPGGGRTAVKAFLGLMLGFVVLILLITCTNVAGMLLTHSSSRSKEVAVRLAIGSSRGQLIHQLLSESMLLFGLGGLVGALLATLALRSISLANLPLPVVLDIHLTPDLRVLSLAMLVTLLSGLIFGSIPALKASRPDLVAALKGLDDSRNNPRLRRLLVTAQIAASVVLLVAAGLFVRSLQKIHQLETGFNSTGVFLTGVDLSLEGYDSPERGISFYEDVLELAMATPGVLAAAFSTDLPLDMSSRGWSVEPEGWSAQPDAKRPSIDINQVTPAYLDTLEIELLEGRMFTDSDRPSSEPVALASHEMVRRLWPDQTALGKHLKLLGEPGEPSFRIVGVVADVKNMSVTESPRPMAYFPLSQTYSPEATNFSVRFAADHGIGNEGAVLRSALHQIDPSLSLTPVVSLADMTGIAVLPQKAAAWVTSCLGLVALLLTGLGIYGIIALSVASRTREIGIRMALGAHQPAVLRAVLRDTLRLAAPGAVIGLLSALALARLSAAFLIEIQPGDPVTLIAVSSMLVAVVILAALMPAKRAASVDPAEVLRSE